MSELDKDQRKSEQAQRERLEKEERDPGGWKAWIAHRKELKNSRPRKAKRRL